MKALAVEMLGNDVVCSFAQHSPRPDFGISSPRLPPSVVLVNGNLEPFTGSLARQIREKDTIDVEAVTLLEKLSYRTVVGVDGWGRPLL